MRRAEACVAMKATACHLLHEKAELLDDAAQLLALQWPAQAFPSRRHGLLANMRERQRNPRFPLPCHMLLTEAGDEEGGGREVLVAHCRLQPACENADGYSAAMTSLVVHPERRRRGLGRVMLQHAEAAAAAAGFGYLYLWTSDAQGFYASCGYRECERVSLLRPSLSRLGSAAVSKLEALMANRHAAATAEAREDGNGGGGGGGGGGGAIEAVAREDSTWMRRRLLELGASPAVTRDAMLASISGALRGYSVAPGRGWAVRLVDVTLERQVGPCCGLAALRMARSALRSAPADAPTEAAADGAAAGGVPALPLGWRLELSLAGRADASEGSSVLEAALARGFSSDGEIFDVRKSSM